MIAIDTNILVYAHRAEMPQHPSALRALDTLGYSDERWAIPWPCVHEFLAVVTGPAFGAAASPVSLALDTMESWIRHPNCHLIGEREDHLTVLGALAQRARLSGGGFHDARIAALCLQHAVSELWTTDRDFQRFPDLRIRDPLIAGLNEPLRDYRPTEPATSLPSSRRKRRTRSL